MAPNPSSQTGPVFLRDLDRAARRRALGLAIIRVAAYSAILLSLYFVIPVGGFNDQNPMAAWIRLAGVVLVFFGVLAYQMRTILAARVPQIRAAETVVEAILMFLCLFALLYVSLSVTDNSSFNEALSRTDALYFTTSTFATVGFGDITPVSELARALVSVQMIADLGALLVIVKVAFFTAARRLGGQ
ncbi:potassium channel family protein [Arthrobacter sp. E44]|uniref:potassium channel family protein n=1 Tax=Arthrobacter sp. E44 TaxID=3341794 RepID=UPI0035A6357D